MDDFIIGEYDLKDRESSIDLLKRTFGEGSGEANFRWRFESNNRLPPLIICARNKDKVISFISWIPWEFTLNGKKIIGYQAGEGASEKEYRRKGIWNETVKYADKIALERNVDFLFGYPSGMSYGPFYRAGYTPIGTFYYCNRIINPFKKRLAEKADHTFKEITQPAIIQENKITPLFDENYYNWRYLENPNNYDVIKYRENNNEAVFILRARKYYNAKFKIKLNEILLLDCQLTSYHDYFINNAFNYLDKIYAGKALYMTTFINENTDRGKAIRRAFGSTIKSWNRIYCIKPISNMDYNALFNFNSWDMMPHTVDYN